MICTCALITRWISYNVIFGKRLISWNLVLIKGMEYQAVLHIENFTGSILFVPSSFAFLFNYSYDSVNYRAVVSSVIFLLRRKVSVAKQSSPNDMIRSRIEPWIVAPSQRTDLKTGYLVSTSALIDMRLREPWSNINSICGFFLYTLWFYIIIRRGCASRSALQKKLEMVLPLIGDSTSVVIGGEARDIHNLLHR